MYSNHLYRLYIKRCESDVIMNLSVGNSIFSYLFINLIIHDFSFILADEEVYLE